MPEIKEHELPILGHLIEANDGSDYKRLHLSYLDSRIDGAGFKDGVITHLTSHQAATEAIKELKGRLEEAERDAARYRWLRDNTDLMWSICHWSDDDNAYFRDERAPGIVDAAIDIDRALSLEGGGET
jgi:hypothetical protein